MSSQMTGTDNVIALVIGVCILFVLAALADLIIKGADLLKRTSPEYIADELDAQDAAGKLHSFPTPRPADAVDVHADQIIAVTREPVRRFGVAR